MFKEHINVVFIGHVDAGKSTMGGNILYLTGMVDKRTMEKYEKEARELNRESWYLSWALDTGAEERNKGKTVECGRAFFETDKRRYTILDAPGHKNYVPSMIGGVSQADIAILVISARKGEFETGFERGGQTREHAVLAKTNGVNKMVVVINKMDDPTVQWSKERYDECVSKLTPFLKGTGYNPKTDLTFMPISGFSGANLKDPVAKDVCSWYDGPSLLQFLDAMQMLERKMNAPLMMPITDKSKASLLCEMGTTVGGKIESGHVKKGKRALVMPGKKMVEIAGIQIEEDEVDAAVSGDNVRLRLRGVEEEARFILCSPKNPAHVVRSFEAQLAILDHKNIICAGYSAVMHIHTAVEEITLGALLHLVDKKTNRISKRPPPFIKKGQKAIVRIETTAPLCVETFDDYPQLGRFTLRDEGKTVAIGKVTKLLAME
ncbi:P-loop containing nucleoside triphosphate hydrolase protein [Syncephalis pseudoplumigaleata]|uniref:Eukaryotic peptide chain release factor GTP-binding subunit n=1 Tax=Syncephalis pseudoplumigaleata TaxID=1712513 RepID=A0A4P9Z0C0_9FUNG|nr:P-loop containing nucleoside triphosphate hydrolase protein [Syncephalis pseudoplumigaleata]|eukprot:RKP25856.1 P-loop containing nucleoside triphosphate hydrolase protein [Syncephalis pseudoplumigaleata]